MRLELTDTAASLMVISCLFVSGRASAGAMQCVVENNSAVLLRNDHHLTAARDAYRACIAEVNCPAVVRSECAAALGELKAQIPSLLVTAVGDDKRPLTQVSLSLDGNPVASDGSPIEVDPGEHVLVANRDGKQSTTVKITVTEGELERSVEIVLSAPAPEPLSAPPPLLPAPAIRTQPKPRVAAPPPRERQPTTLLPAYLMGGAAVVGASSFAFFGISGHSKRIDLFQCKPNCDPADVRRVRSDFLVADISLGVTLVALAGAGYWLLSHSEEDPPAKPEAALSVSVFAPRGGGGLSIRWRQ